MRSWDNSGRSNGPNRGRREGVAGRCNGRMGRVIAGKKGLAKRREDRRLRRRDDLSAPEPVEEIPPWQDQNSVRRLARRLLP